MIHQTLKSSLLFLFTLFSCLLMNCIDSGTGNDSGHSNLPKDFNHTCFYNNYPGVRSLCQETDLKCIEQEYRDMAALGGNIEYSCPSDSNVALYLDSALEGIWVETGYDTIASPEFAWFQPNRLEVLDVGATGSVSFSALNGLISIENIKVVEYLIENDTLYLERLLAGDADGVVDKTMARSFIRFEGNPGDSIHR